MKYIRTKYGTIELNREEIEREIIKQADTIDELIDGWVLESKAYTSGFFVIYNTEDNKQKMRNFKLFEYEKLFAFIKTDKGLIYVAKMKGVLPNGEIDWELL